MPLYHYTIRLPIPQDVEDAGSAEATGTAELSWRDYHLVSRYSWSALGLKEILKAVDARYSHRVQRMGLLPQRRDADGRPRGELAHWFHAGFLASVVVDTQLEPAPRHLAPGTLITGACVNYQPRYLRITVKRSRPVRDAWGPI